MIYDKIIDLLETSEEIIDYDPERSAIYASLASVYLGMLQLGDRQDQYEVVSRLEHIPSLEEMRNVRARKNAAPELPEEHPSDGT